MNAIRLLLALFLFAICTSSLPAQCQPQPCAATQLCPDLASCAPCRGPNANPSPIASTAWDPRHCWVGPCSGTSALRVYSHRQLFLTDTASELLTFPVASATNSRTRIPAVGGVRTRTSTTSVALRTPFSPALLNTSIGNPSTPPGALLLIDGGSQSHYDVVSDNGNMTAFGFEFLDCASVAAVQSASVFRVSLRDSGGNILEQFTFQTNSSAWPNLPQGAPKFIGVSYPSGFAQVWIREVFGCAGADNRNPGMPIAGDDERFGPFYMADNGTEGERVTALTTCDPATGSDVVTTNPLRSYFVRHSSGGVTSVNAFASFFDLSPSLNGTEIAANNMLLADLVIGVPPAPLPPGLRPDPFAGLRMNPSTQQSFFSAGYGAPWNGFLTASGVVTFQMQGLPANLPRVFAVGLLHDSFLPWNPYFTTSPTVLEAFGPRRIPACQWQ